MHELTSGVSRSSRWLSVGLAVLALALALRVRPLAWMFVLCLVPAAILIGASPTLLGIERSHPRFSRMCHALSLVAYLGFMAGLVLHVSHR